MKRLGRVPKPVQGALVGGLIGGILGKDYLLLSQPLDGLILGLLEGVIIGVILVRSRADGAVTMPALLAPGPVTLTLLGVVIGTFGGSMATFFYQTAGLRFLCMVMGALLGGLIGVGLWWLQKEPERVAATHTRFWTAVGTIIILTPTALEGAWWGAGVGAILGAVGGGIAIVGLFGPALLAALTAAFVGAIIGTLINLTFHVEH